MWLVQGKLDSEFHITVALDGSGDFNTISHAVNAAPNYSRERYYIRIKAGTYVQNVVVGKKKTNISFIGDGMDVTIITGNKSVGKVSSTFETTTVGMFYLSQIQKCTLFHVVCMNCIVQLDQHLFT